MLYGYPPFAAEDPMTTYSNIVAWQDNLEFPAAIPVNLASIDDTSYFDNFPDVQIDINPMRAAASVLSTQSEGGAVSGSSWLFLNYTFKRFEGFTQRGKLKKKF